MREPLLPRMVRYIEPILAVILFLKLAGYFSITEDRTITQLFKTFGRLGATAMLLGVFHHLKDLGHLAPGRITHTSGPILYLAYLGLGALSFLWTSDLKVSMLQWAMIMESFFFSWLFVRTVVMVNTHHPERRIDLFRVFSHAIFPIMVTFLIGGLFAEDVFHRGMRGGEEKRLGGWIMNPNELGMLASIGAAMAFMVALTTRSRIIPVLMLVVACQVMFATGSRSSAIGSLVLMAFLILKSTHRALRIGAITLLVLGIPLVAKYVIFKVGGGIEEVMSMTGRLPFWSALLQEGFVQHPYLGNGFMRIGPGDTFQGLNTYPGRMAHNTFIQVLMNLGAIGGLVVLAQVVASFSTFLRERAHPYAPFFLVLFIPIMINSLTEFGVFGETNYGILFYQILVLLFTIRPNLHLTLRQRLQGLRATSHIPSAQ
jgi:exopolysaccharide production protein ExoQ